MGVEEARGEEEGATAIGTAGHGPRGGGTAGPAEGALQGAGGRLLGMERGAGFFLSWLPSARYILPMPFCVEDWRVEAPRIYYSCWKLRILLFICS